MTRLAPVPDGARTNGQLIEAAVEVAGAHAAQLARWARSNPDEVIVALAPAVAVALSTRRHYLSIPEAVALSQVAYWCGVMAVRTYKEWKGRPAGAVPEAR